ncbi:CD166 antigen homolog [Cottoperca gobio]|uniref:CD166 antigen homolog n=1 Tax=Cottoperca gobio TaxID=56716 RepID=A0A6J2RC03_COTGO|nr:CD166 antigen homolog [Cottoperca gobio]
MQQLIWQDEPVTVTLIQEKEPGMEGGSVIVECAANCNPQPHKYTWLKRQKGLINKISSTERRKPFHNITRDTSLSCIAYNDIGTGKSDWLDLEVQYAPEILPESSCHLTGEVLKCVCQAEASPNASIHWTINGNNNLTSSFIFVSTNKKNVVSGEISAAAQNQSNISCTATNSLGSNTKQLSVLSKTSSLYMWLMALLLGLLFGCAMFIYREYSKNRPQRPQSISVNVQEEHSNTNIQRSQDEDTQSNPYTPESNPEVDEPSCIYNNELVEEIRRPTIAQRHKNNRTAPQREGEIQPLEKSGVDCNTDVYLNC